MTDLERRARGVDMVMRWTVPVGTLVVIGSAVRAYVYGPAWAIASLWFFAGFCVAMMLVNLTMGLIWQRRVVADRDEAAKIAGLFVSAVEREMSARGLVGDEPKRPSGETRH